jgi:hypothetical protein
MNFIPTSKIQKPAANRENANKDQNLKSFEVIYGEVVDKSKRQAIASFSKAAHFNFTSPCKYIIPPYLLAAKPQKSTNETFYTP